MPLPQVVVKTRAAELAKAPAQSAPAQSVLARPIAPADLRAIAELYNRANATRTCSLVRRADTYKGFARGTGWWLRAEAMAFEDGERRFVGYAAWDKTNQAVNVMEVEAVDEAFYPALLVYLAQQAVDKRCENITFNMPPDHPFAQYLQRFGCVWTITYPRDSDGMLRVVNQSALLEKLHPEFERRLSAGRLDRIPVAVVIRTELGETALSFGSLDCISLELPQDKLAQLLAGYRSVHNVLSEPGVRATAGSEPVLSALFPPGHPYVWLADQF
jgi:hypothetical protein